MRLHDYGIITSNDKASWAERAREVIDSIREVRLAFNQACLGVEGFPLKGLAIEFPGPGVSSARNIAYLPRYGVAVGWAMGAVLGSEGPGWDWTETPTASEWSKQIGAPGTKNDEHKTRRQDYIRRFLGIEMDIAKSLGGDVADAILIAHWAAQRLRMWALRTGRAGRPMILALDPSITATGYAILEGDPV